MTCDRKRAEPFPVARGLPEGNWVTDYLLPEGTDGVVDIYVDGVRQTPGTDYEVEADRVRFARTLHPAASLSRWDKILVALCASVPEEGESVDAILRAGRRLYSVPLSPVSPTR